ncbi:2-hydroxyacid dehydrogenase [Thalassoroseus pseudoceratinae]|uniref:2-hydroxyacid dehydrogenase n=1 Tax=Thalassoroseus pseudoceratinae TaxID=2713176 RepID=UPI00141DEA8F|nr:2-hydroxyacid dehydrogenase [Thalassoroseus pseudoceratinae]
MKVALFSTKPYDRKFFKQANQESPHELTFLEPRLTPLTAPLAKGYDAACLFVNDQADAETLEVLADSGVKVLALRCAGFNNVDLNAAERLGLTVVRVPAYSPHAVAEHTVGLMLTLNRQIHRGYNRVREGNFALDGLLGFDLHEKVVGIIGTGIIGAVVAKILSGFGCHLLAYDVRENPDCVELGVNYTSLDEIYAKSDVITLHCPLTPQTHHLINADAIAEMKPGVMLINTSRGGIVETPAVIDGLKTSRVGSLGIDVYEEEGDLFFEDLSNFVIRDDVFARLLTFPNVLVTGHQAFFTEEALQQIAGTTLGNLQDLADGRECPNEVSAAKLSGG